MDILEHFRQTNALLEGHFILSSGLHSPKYLQCALALQYPADAAKFGHAIAEHFTNENIETVASPAIGGLVIGYAVAEALNVRFIWTERQNGEMTLRRGLRSRKTSGSWSSKTLSRRAARRANASRRWNHAARA
jgi:orotate phosphoribosyltransferase